MNKRIASVSLYVNGYNRIIVSGAGASRYKSTAQLAGPHLLFQPPQPRLAPLLIRCPSHNASTENKTTVWNKVTAYVQKRNVRRGAGVAVDVMMKYD